MLPVLPVLGTFFLKGANKYLEDLIAWIDAPQLEVWKINLYGQTIYGIPRFSQFISCPTLLVNSNRRFVLLSQRHRVSINLPLPTRMSGDGYLRLDILF